jgi:hypothetical protein
MARSGGSTEEQAEGQGCADSLGCLDVGCTLISCFSIFMTLIVAAAAFAVAIACHRP